MNFDKKSNYFNFIEDIIKNEITAYTYSQRADIILTSLDPEIQELEYGNSLVSCETTAGFIINELLNENPSAIENIKCSSNDCNFKSESSIMYLTYQINTEGQIKDMQTFLTERVKQDYMTCGPKCDNVKTLETNISKIHLFIDVLYWEGK